VKIYVAAVEAPKKKKRGGCEDRMNFNFTLIESANVSDVLLQRKYFISTF
jgi:hypothetical protein